MNAPATPVGLDLPDEHTLVIPNAWRRQSHPRRGGLPAVTANEPAIEAAGALLRKFRPEVEETLADSRSEPELTERAQAHLRGEATPAGAAVVAAVVVARSGRQYVEGRDLFVESWVAEHGLAFAACAFAELSTVVADRNDAGGRRERPRVRYARTGDHVDGWWAREPVARRIRTLLATAGERDYQDAVERLAHRRRTPPQRVVVSYLVPTRQDWVDECCANPPGSRHERFLRWMLFCALGSGHQLDLLGGRMPLEWVKRSPSVIATLVEGIGPAIAPLLAETLDGDLGGSDTRKPLLDVLALLPTDEAFQIMVDRLDQRHVQPALLGAMKRFPVRALRLLAPAAEGTSKTAARAADLLRGHLLADPGLTAAALPDLPAEVRTVIESISAATVRVPDAPAEGLPPLLVAPPWTRERKAPEPVVIGGLKPPAEQAVNWAPGEREKWAEGSEGYWRWDEDTDWRKLLQEYRAGKVPRYREAGLFVDGPEELIRPLFTDWRPEYFWNTAEWMPPIVARFELDARPVALRAAQSNPAGNGSVLLPFLDAEVALIAAGWLTRLKSARKHALAWFGRHGLATAPLLLPAALGKAGAARRDAEGALRHLAGGHGAEGIVEAARAYGDEAAHAIEALLATDLLEILPARMPKIGDWVDPAVLPQVLLRGRERALPTAATGHLLTMLAMSKPGEVYPGIDVVRELCDPESLTEFAWALFQRWQAYGAPSKDGWALTQLGRLGDDETVRRLTPVIRAWPGEGGHSKAVNGLDVLAAIGSDVALMHLHGIAQKVKFKGLKTRAQEKIEEVAAELELTAEQLADRLVPDFGLDADGGMVLDYGPRRFVVGFDEQLKPYVADEDGKRRKALPKPGVKDDDVLAPAAYKRFAGLKKDVRTAAADQIHRLESAMVTGRRWPMKEFHDFFVNHPLLWHIVRRVVWVAEDGDKSTTFRLAEDRTFTDATDDVLALPGSAEVGIVHPVHLGEELETWSEVFADYEILQPFPQLGRTVHILTEEERMSGRLERFEGATVPTGKMLGLERRGWRRGEPQDAGVERWISRQVADDRYLVIDLDPGIAVGVVDALPEQTLQYVWLGDRPTDFWPSRGTSRRFGELDPATASEVLADLTELTESAS